MTDQHSAFHLSRPSEVLRYFPSAINEYRELAVLLSNEPILLVELHSKTNLSLEKGVFR